MANADNNMNMTFPFHVLLLLALFCFTSPLQARGPALELWHSQQAGYVIDEVIARFNREQDQRVSVLQIEPSKIKGDILLAAQSRGLPDLMLIPSDFLGLYRQMKLAPLPADWFSNELMAETLSYVTLDRQRWGMPMMQGNHLMLFYNKELVSTPVTEWQQFAQIAPDLTARGIMPISWPYEDMYYLAAFLRTFGGSPVTDGRITLDTPAMVQALEAYRTVARQGWVDPDGDYDAALSRFSTGRSAYLINGDWAFSDLTKNMGERLGVALLPAWQTRPMSSMSGAYVIGVAASAMEDEDRRPVIQALMAFIQRSDTQDFIYRRGALLPVNRDSFAAIGQSPDPRAHVLLEQFTRSAPMPSGSAMAVAWQAMATGFERAREGGSATDTARYMQQLADRQHLQVNAP